MLSNVPDITKLVLLLGGITTGLVIPNPPVTVNDKYPPVAFRIVQKFPALVLTTSPDVIFTVLTPEVGPI